MVDNERKLATIRRVSEIRPIEGADLIELAIIGGWQCVVKKDEFKINDSCVYVEIDSIMPDHPEFEFLRSKKFRIKTIKLKGQLSQGIIFPLSILGSFSRLGTPAEDKIFIEGDDVTDIIGVVKYEPPIPAQLAGTVRGAFPSRVPKTDEERIQNLLPEIENIRKSNMELVVSEKLDGTSSSFMILNDEFHVCSRNLDLKEYTDDEVLGERTKELKNTFWKFARENDIENKLRQYCTQNDIKNIAIQGELIGEGIQKNRYNLKGQKVYFFNGFNIDTQKYLSHDELQFFLKEARLESVPIISESFFLEDKTIQNLLDFADGTSVLNDKQMREGLVFKCKEIQPENFGKVSFKAISNKFLLKYEE